MNPQSQPYSSFPSVGVPIRNISDYSPFGVALDGRTVSMDSYRYGYQGSEKDDEMKGGGNSYTTYYRQLDPRVGRWFSIDPKMSAWESPYVSMGNNPNMFNDVLGDTIKFQSPEAEKLYSSMKSFVFNKIAVNNDKLLKAQNRLKNYEKNGNTFKINEQNAIIENLINENNLYSEIQDELKCLESSKVIYRIRFGKNDFHPETSPENLNDAGGSFSYNKSTNELDVNVKSSYTDPITGTEIGFSNIQKLAHELKHGFQYQNKTISLNFRFPGRAYDITDEYEAYERQNLFATTLTQKTMDVKSHVNKNYPKLFKEKPNAQNVMYNYAGEQSNLNGESCNQ